MDTYKCSKCNQDIKNCDRDTQNSIASIHLTLKNIKILSLAKYVMI